VSPRVARASAAVLSGRRGRLFGRRLLGGSRIARPHTTGDGARAKAAEGTLGWRTSAVLLQASGAVRGCVEVKRRQTAAGDEDQPSEGRLTGSVHAMARGGGDQGAADAGAGAESSSRVYRRVLAA
jgi:hypothetical protein